MCELRERCSEMRWQIEMGALKAEHEYLEGQVLQLQESFQVLQSEFKTEKLHYGEQLALLGHKLDEQQRTTSTAERRVICTEDLVRFHEEQRRLLAAHWKAQCQQKDERIRSLNLQLTEYTIDWQHLGTQKQTMASLSHELQCLRDRHEELSAASARRNTHKDGLVSRLAAAKAEVDELQHAVETATSELHSADGSQARASELLTARLRNAGLKRQLEVLERWRTRANVKSSPTPWPHACIWRDELDVRQWQLEKIMAQLDKTNSALHKTQTALALQRARHEEMKSEHREAEMKLRSCETQRTILRRQAMDLRRAEDGLQRALTEELGHGAQRAPREGHINSVDDWINTLNPEAHKSAECQRPRFASAPASTAAGVSSVRGTVPHTREGGPHLQPTDDVPTF